MYIFQWSLSILFALAGSAKLLSAKPMHEQFKEFGFPKYFMIVVGALEVIGAIGLQIKNLSIYAAIGLLLVVYSMGYLGFKKAFGRKVDGLNQAGIYRLTRNPQIVFYAILLVGVAVIWLSWHTIVWVFLFFIVAHMMVITEEEHLRDVYGESYEQYCRQVPRYLFI